VTFPFEKAANPRANQFCNRKTAGLARVLSAVAVTDFAWHSLGQANLSVRGHHEDLRFEGRLMQSTARFGSSVPQKWDDLDAIPEDDMRNKTG
jgi:hypothetical protein